MRYSQWCAIIALTLAGTLCAQSNEGPNFWFLEQGTEPIAENRIKAIQNVGRGLLDFAIYQPTGYTFPEEYRQKLLDAGFVFDFLTEEQLAQIYYIWSDYRHSHHGRFPILVIPQMVSLPTKEIERLRMTSGHSFAFLEKAPKLPTQMGLNSFVNRKDIGEAERMSLQTPMCNGIDQIGENLAEAVGLFSGLAATFPENFVAESGVKLLARRALPLNESLRNYDSIDVFYIFANTKENAKPIDGWFQLREIHMFRFLATFENSDGKPHWVIAKNDRAFIMDPETGKIGEAAIHHDRSVSRFDLYVRIQMKPGETLIVRVVRERAKSGNGPPSGGGFQEFESLPAWEYEGEPPEPPGK